ncbi:hypothetical protein NDR87_20805 [Nocardia sp. CDC159]|uniref:Uncharacterized protein n=1 Tax=Nocardia pulmonis TaxID=2951408 RepID=A0A9X2E929_9NOCA|nr:MULTISPECIES: hypothetical protein [Nocardia]MCM6776387.1 hypothetical protein [Nocardia pulmonis]MCM6788811.1 hypothetical protein [Nocardia sp. CDC159]
MIDNTNTAQESGNTQNPVVWPDPSPLSSWWDAVMRGEGAAKQRVAQTTR